MNKEDIPCKFQIGPNRVIITRSLSSFDGALGINFTVICMC